MANIVVVGAGVTGLTTAYMLSEKGYNVTIIAKKFSFDGYDDPCYTSNFAGANWQSFASPDETELKEFDLPGYKKFIKLAETEPKSGVSKKLNISQIEKSVFAEKYNNDPTKVPLPWYKDHVKGFRIIPSSELSENVGFATEYLGVSIHVVIYLNYLLNKCIESGATYKRVSLDHIKDANRYHSSGAIPDAVVNCTGLLASKLGGVQDLKVYPVKGQLIVVENNISAVQLIEYFDPDHPEDMLYAMPRIEGGSIIGGCMLLNDWDPKFDHARGKRILAAATKYMPEFIDPKVGNPEEFKIIRYQVGFRPGRTGGPRVERDGNIKNLVHNYGIGGAGYQSSYGTCAKTVRLVESILNRSKL